MKKKHSVGFGAVALVVGGLICKALGAAFRLPLTNLLGLEGIGVFSLVMSVLSFATVLTSGGVTGSLSKLVASSFAQGQKEVNSYISHASKVTLLLSFCVGVVFALLGGWISPLQGADAWKTYLLFPLLLPLCGMLCVFRGAFQGCRNMFPTATSQVLEQIFKFCLGLLFAKIFLPLGVEMGVFGAFFGITLSEIVAVIFLAILYFFSFKNQNVERDLQVVRMERSEFDSANFTLMLSALVLPLVSAIDSLFIVKRLTLAGLTETASRALFGLQSGVVGTILNLPLVISLSVSTALLPNLAYQISKGSLQKETVERALEILLFLIFPTTFGIVAVGEPLISVLYPQISASLTKTALQLLFYGGFGIILTALMQFFAMLLQAYGQFRFLLVSSAVGGILKLVLTFFLSAIPEVNIFAVVIGNVVMSGTVCVFAIFKLKKISSFSVGFLDVFLFAFATFLMFCVVKIFLSTSQLNGIFALAIAVAIGIFVYAVFSLPFLFKLWKSWSKSSKKGNNLSEEI